MSEELLKQIVKNTEPKISRQIIVTNKETEFTVNFDSPIELDSDKHYEIALVNLETYYSFPNITKNNNVLKYIASGNLKEIALPPGSYEIEAINSEIQRLLKINGDDEKAITIAPNRSTLQTIMEVKPGYIVSFTGAESLRKVLGFQNKDYPAGIHESERIIDIMHINAILIHLNIINGSYINNTTSPVIYSFFPNVSPGYKIVETPVNLVYLPVVVKTIKSLKITITDQDGKILNLRGERVTMRFHLRES